jgi:hypothetical protein
MVIFSAGLLRRRGGPVLRPCYGACRSHSLCALPRRSGPCDARPCTGEPRLSGSRKRRYGKLSWWPRPPRGQYRLGGRCPRHRLLHVGIASALGGGLRSLLSPARSRRQRGKFSRRERRGRCRVNPCGRRRRRRCRADGLRARYLRWGWGSRDHLRCLEDMFAGAVHKLAGQRGFRSRMRALPDGDVQQRAQRGRMQTLVDLFARLVRQQ